MIDGVVVKELKVVPDDRGFLMEVLRRDDSFFSHFGQAYITAAYPGKIKAWRLHREQEDNIFCVRGMIKLVMYDTREDSPTSGELVEVFTGEHRPAVVHMPRGLYHGWKCISTREAWVMNFTTEPYRHDRPDVERLEADTDRIPYDWTIKMG